MSAVIEARPDLLRDFYARLAPVLISRFNDREESVQLEILSAFDAMLRQTVAACESELASIGRNKRKRAEGFQNGVKPEDRCVTPGSPQSLTLSATAQLRALLPQITRAISKQLSSRSIGTRSQGFHLLQVVSDILPGGLDNDAGHLLAQAQSVIDAPDLASNHSIVSSALAFLATFFIRHSSKSYASFVARLSPGIVRCMKDRAPRISSDAFVCASSLASRARAKGSISPLSANISSPVTSFCQAAVEVLGSSSVDADVREKAMLCLGDLLVHEGDVLTDYYSGCLPLISARLANDSTSHLAISVIGSIALSPYCKGPRMDSWLESVIPEVLAALRHSKRPAGKTSAFANLQNIVHRCGSGLQTSTSSPPCDGAAVLRRCAADVEHMGDRPEDIQASPRPLWNLISCPLLWMS